MKKTFKNHLVKTAFGISLALGCLPISAQDENNSQSINEKDARVKAKPDTYRATVFIPTPKGRANAGQTYKVPFKVTKFVDNKNEGILAGMKAYLTVKSIPQIPAKLKEAGIKVATVVGSVEVSNGAENYVAVFPIPAKPSGIPPGPDGHEAFTRMNWVVTVDLDNPTYGKSHSQSGFTENFNN